MQTNKAEGPFILGAQPSLTDFFFTAALQSARVVDEKIFDRIIRYAGYKEIYNACIPYMEKQDWPQLS